MSGQGRCLKGRNMSNDSERLQGLLDRINEIATLQHIIMQVMQVANDPKSNVSDLR
jgi:hypothetical protein